MPEQRPLEAAYGATSVDEIAHTYDDWAETYDGEMSRLGYRHPAICIALLARHLPAGASPILDAGAGTGLIGEWLRIIGYPEADALDISAGMLAVAERKGVYARLHRAVLGEPLPFADGSFAAAVCAGVFTTGHVGAEGLDELLRVVRPQGVLVLTVKDKTWEAGFGARVEALAAAGRVLVQEMTPSYVSMPGEPDTVPSRGLVLGMR